MGASSDKTGLFGSTKNAGLFWCTYENNYPAIPVLPGRKRPSIKKWEQFNHRTPTANEAREWSSLFPGHSIGIAAASKLGFLGIDCDVRFRDGDQLDYEQSRACWKILVEILDGKKPPTRIGLAPKWLALVGTDRKHIASRKAHPFEIFGHSGQFVAWGIHEKTGKPYQWFHGSPIDTAIDELPVITETGINHWLMECAKIIGRDTQPKKQAQPGTGTKSDNLRTELSVERRHLKGRKYGAKIIEQLNRLGSNNKSDTLISVVSSLIYRGFSDSQIVEICQKPYLDKWEGIEEHGIEFLERMLERVRNTGHITDPRKLWGQT